MINRTEGHFHGHDGAELFYQTWLQEKPAGTLVVTHGLSEHSECYKLFADGISQSGWDIYAWDLRGHGRSDGKRGLVYDFTEYTRDLNVFTNYVNKQRSNSQGPLVLVGHSMGGLISSRTLIDFPQLPVKALCLSSPAFGISMPVPKLKDKAAHFLSQWLPRLTLNSEVHYERLSHDEDVLQSYPKDPLRHDRISPRLYLGMIDSFNYVISNAHKLTLPVFMQASGEDLIVNLEKADEFFDRLGSERKERIVYENSFHEIYNDVERATVFADLTAFLKKVEAL